VGPPRIKILKNKLTVGVLENPNSESVAIHLKGLAGSNREGKDMLGATHLLEHIFLNSSEGKEEEAMHKKLLRKGAKLYGITSRDDVLYMAKTLSSECDLGIKYLSEILTNKHVTKKAVEKQKQIVIQEIKANTEKIPRHLSNHSLGLLFPNTRMVYPNTGTQESLERLEREKLEKLKWGLYKNANFVLTVAGNVSAEKVFSTCERYFNRGSQENRNRPGKIPANQELNIAAHTGSVYKLTHLRVDYPSISMKNAARVETNMLALLTKALLKKVIDTKRIPVYYLDCVHFTATTFGIFSTYIQINEKHLNAIVGILKECMQNLPEYASPEILATLKKQYIANTAFTLEKNSSWAEYYSNLLLHGNKNHNHIWEKERVAALNRIRLEKAHEKLISCKPKITVLSPGIEKKRVEEICKEHFS
jgi:predicted Zn-dependent peptidase